MKKFILISALLITIMVAGCGSFPGSIKNDLDGTAWTLISFNGESLIADTAMTAFFEDGEVVGSASCNHYFGSYKNKGTQIQIDGLGWTEMACLNPEGVMEQEQQLMSMFMKAETISLQGQILEISTTAGDLMFFQQAETRE
jgi:heat shock protein HslJ